MDYDKYINQASKQEDMTKQTSGEGGDGKSFLPAAGTCMMRLVAYIECGKHKNEYKGKVTYRDKAKMVFELMGKKYPAGDFGPLRITTSENISLHEKSNFAKLFNMMRDGDDSITHMAQLLGKPFIGKITHKEKGDKTYANLRDENGYNIKSPVVEDPISGDVKSVEVPDAKSELRLFLWDYADKDMWDSIYIDGEYSSGNSKNVLQSYIREANNFEGSRAQQASLEGQSSQFLPEGEVENSNEEGSGDEKATKKDVEDAFSVEMDDFEI